MTPAPTDSNRPKPPNVMHHITAIPPTTSEHFARRPTTPPDVILSSITGRSAWCRLGVDVLP